MRVKRAAKYGFCSGVRIADLKVKRFAATGAKGAILGQVVHNERVVEEMELLGVRTVDEITAVEEPTIVFSAHGVPPSFHQRARDNGLQVLDTTCKFVYDIHRESKNALEQGFHLVFIGDPRHRGLPPADRRPSELDRERCIRAGRRHRDRTRGGRDLPR